MSRNIGTATVQVKADTSMFRSALDGVGGSLGRLSGAVAALGLGSYAKEAIQFGAATTIELDRATAMFRGLTSSQEEAEAMLKRMTEYAINTPFELPNLAKTTAQLIATGKGFGVTTENATWFMDILGNVTSASGGTDETLTRLVRVLGQMSSSGKVLGQDMNQLAQNIPGLDVWGALSKGTGESVEELRKLQDEGKLDELLTGNEAVEILLASMAEFPGAAGAMERQMDTLGGAISKFKETLAIAMSTGLSPFFTVLRGVMADPATMQSLEGLIGAFGALASTIIAGLAPALPAIVQGMTIMTSALKPLAPVLAAIGELFGQLLQAAAPAIKLVSQALAKLAPILAPIGDLFSTVFGVIIAAAAPILDVLVDLLLQLAGTVLPPLQKMLRALEPVFALIGEALATLISAALPPFIDMLGQILDALAPLIPVLGELVGALLEAFLPIIVALIPLLIPLAPLFVAIAAALVPLLMIVTKVATMLIEFLMPGFELVAAKIQWFADSLTGVLDTVIGWVESVTAWFQGLFDGVDPVVRDLVGQIILWFRELQNVVEPIVSAIKDFVVAAWQAISSAVTTFASGIYSAVKWYFGLINTTIDVAVHVAQTIIETVWNAIKGTTETVWNAIKSAVTVPIEAARDLLSGIIDTISGFFDFAGLVDTVTGVWEDVKQAILGPLEAVADAIGGIIDRIKSPVEGVIGTVGKIGGAIGGLIPGRADGDIVTRPTLSWLGEGNRPEAVIPLTNPGRAMQLMQQSGLDRLAAQMNGGRGSYSGPLISMPGAVIQDATDADLVAQRTLVAMQAAMVS